MRSIRLFFAPVAVSSLIGEVLMWLVLGARPHAVLEITLGGWLLGFAFMAVLNAIGLLVVGLPVALQLRRRGHEAGTALAWLAAIGMVGGGLMALPFLAGADLRTFPLAMLIGAGFGLIAALVWTLFNVGEFGRRPPEGGKG